MDTPDFLDRAIADTENNEEYATRESALHWLLESAWCDLHTARRYAINGTWSIECDNQVHRIVGLTKLVGPLSWQRVPVRLILDGIYERIHEAIGTLTPLSDDDRRRVREVASKY